MSEEAPSKSIQFVVWVLYAAIVAWILFIVEKIGEIAGFNWATFSAVTWLAIIVTVTFCAGIVYLALKYVIRVWEIDWVERVKRRLVQKESQSLIDEVVRKKKRYSKATAIPANQPSSGAGGDNKARELDN